MIYHPAEDSFLLGKQVKKFAKGKVLDMGSGSGYQALIALKKTKNVLTADISKEAVELCKSKGLNCIQSDLFSKIKDKFDLIIFNPPYLPLDELEDFDSRLSTTGGKKGNEILIRFLKQARSHLNKDGKIILIVSSLTPNFEDLFKKHKYKFKKLSGQSFFFERIYCYLLSSF